MSDRLPIPRAAASFVIAAATFAILGGALTLLGWIFDLPRLKDWNAGGITMKANAAICALASGTALLVGLRRYGSFYLLLSAIPALLGSLTLFQHLTGINVGIDTLFFSEPPGARATAAPGRMGPPASLSFAVIGTALLLMSCNDGARRWAARCGLIVSLIAALSMIGYTFGASQLYALPRLTGISLQAAAILMALGIGVIASICDHGLCSSLIRQDAGGALLRRLLLPVILLPLVIGFLRIEGESYGLYDSAFGTAARTLVEILLLLVLVWWTATSFGAADEKLRTSEGELKAAQELARIGGWHWNPSTDVTTGSEMLYRIYGLDPKRPFPNFDDQRGTLYPPESWDKLKAAVTEALRSGVGYEFDIPALRCGVPIHITARGSVIRDSAGQIVGLRGTVQDITERKLAEDALRESEERYRNLFTSIDEGFCIIEMIFDPHGKATDYRFSEYNQAFELHTGLKNAVGKTIRELVPNHDDFWFETYGKVAQTGEAVRFEHYAEAMSRWFNVYAFKMGEPAGRKVAVLFSNITARKDAEAALAAANARLAERADQLDVLVSERTARLQETVQELEVFSYSIAHDMRAPLRSMSGFADVLLADYAGELPPEGRELLTRIRRSALRLDQLTLDVLNYTKLGRQEMRVEPVDVKQLLAEILESYPHLTDAAPQIQLQPDYPIVLANRAALAQVFSNLLGNALKFTRKGIPAVVRVYSEGAADNRVRFTIQDNGIGIATKDLPRLFNIFQRVHSETSFEGTGIGLALVRKATQRMGGTFGVDSEPDRGSRFWVELKRAP